jgi:hypothetical protein
MTTTTNITLLLIATTLLLGCINAPPEGQTTTTIKQITVTAQPVSDETLPSKVQNDYQTALQKSDGSGCESLTDVQLRDNCYNDVAQSKVRADLCAKINDATRVDKCYLTIVINTKDKSLCSKISDTQISTACNRVAGNN